MIDALYIGQFKRFGALSPAGSPTWETTPSVTLAPITILLGGNSAGKSTIIHSLLALAQSWEEPRFGAGRLRLNGRLAQLGTFSGVRHGHEPGPIFLGYTEGDTTRQFRAIHTYEERIGERGGALTALWLGECTPGSEAARGCSFSCWNTPDSRGGHALRLGIPAGEVLAELRLGLELSEAPDGYQVVVWHDQVRTFRVNEGVESPLHASERGVGDFLEGAVNRWLRSSVRRDGGISYIGPMRKPVPRVTESAIAGPIDVGPDGAETAQLLIADAGVREEVNRYFACMEVPYTLTVEETATARTNLASVVLVSTGPGTPHRVGVQDVGFGIGQLLPVLTQYAALSLRERSEATTEVPILVAEQPELHLHPALQARLASVLVGLDSRDPGKGRRPWAVGPKPPQVVLETHSEHMLLRIQHHVRSGNLDPSNVAVLALEPNIHDGTPCVRRLELEPDGSILEWPESFFDVRQKEYEDA